MAVTGTGTSSDPYIVHDWTEFEATNTDTNKGKYMRFADIHVENGEFNISGTGTSAEDPCIVSTYREMLYATGATNIHLCKCINKDLPNGERLYVYKSEDPETHVVTSKYCRYNPAPSTIDYNNISDSYRRTIYIYCYIDFNGWALKNFKVNIDQGNNQLMYPIFRQENGTNCYIKNLFFINAQIKTQTTTSDSPLLMVPTYDCVIQMEIDASSIGADYKLAFGYSAAVSIYRSSLYLKIVGNCGFSGLMSAGSSYSCTLTECLLELDCDLGRYGHRSATQCGLALVRSTVKGKYKYTSNNTYSLIANCTDSIYDVEHISTVAPIAPSLNGSRCIFNNDVKESPAIQTGWSKTGWTGVTSAQLLSPSELQSVGFPIGVDNNA